MDNIEIQKVAEQFRAAIEAARDDGLFVGNKFDNFPNKCCGDTCYLLAEFFLSKGQESIYICGEDDTGQTHAWLVIKNERINDRIPRPLQLPDEIRCYLNLYSNGAYNADIDISHYTESDVEGGLIVDITADQFGESPVYVGCIYDFYRRFKFREADDYTNLGNIMLDRIYQRILPYLSM